MNSKLKKLIVGYEKLIDFFGYFPTFHDDEILDIQKKEQGILFTLKSNAIQNQETRIKFLIRGVRKEPEYKKEDCPVIFELIFKESEGDCSMELSPCWATKSEEPIKWIFKDMEVLEVSSL